MKIQNSQTGFTLIELLVVVLIIGILASIAVPKYTYVVERSRATKRMQLLMHLAKAQKIYKLEHGRFAGEKDENGVKQGTIDDLSITYKDVDFSDSDKNGYDKNMAVRIFNDHYAINIQHNTTSYRYEKYFYELRINLYDAYGLYRKNIIACAPMMWESENSKRLCQDLCGGAPFNYGHGNTFCIIGEYDMGV